MGGWTPGPWALHYSPHGYEVFAEDASRVITNMPLPVAEYAQDEANARLIAAAPDLYEALIGFIDCYDAGYIQLDSPEMADGDHEPYPWHDEWLAEARAALAKARGETT